MNKINNERGFMLLNVVFLTLITSFAAMILLNSDSRIRNPQAAIRLTAIHLANEQLAMMERLAATEKRIDLNYLGKPEDLTTINFSEENPIEFKVTSTDYSEENFHYIAVKVEWTLNERKDSVIIERTIIVVP